MFGQLRWRGLLLLAKPSQDESLRRERGAGGGRTRTELGNDAVYKLSFDGVNYKIGRASDGMSVCEYCYIWFFCLKCESIRHLNMRERGSSGPE